MNITDKIDLLLKEAVVINKVETPISEKDAEAILESKCSNNLKEIANSTFGESYIFRGNRALRDKYYLFTGKETRASANTSNQYTLLFSDVLPSWSAYPKRNKSLICSNALDVAKNYGTVYEVIPYDTTTIFGSTKNHFEDFWSILYSNKFSRALMGVFNLRDLNDDFLAIFGTGSEFIQNMKKPVSEFSDIDNVKILALCYSGVEPMEARKLANNPIDPKLEKLPIWKLLDKVLAPSTCEVQLINGYKNLSALQGTEIWLDQPAILRRMK